MIPRALLALALVLFGRTLAAAQHEMHGMSREASGTSWQPDSTPHEGAHRYAITCGERARDLPAELARRADHEHLHGRRVSRIPS